MTRIEDGEPVRCPVCAAEGQRSRMSLGGSSRTLMTTQTFYDEDGKLVVRDPNTTTTQWSCSRGHHGVMNARSGHTEIIASERTQP